MFHSGTSGRCVSLTGPVVLCLLLGSATIVSSSGCHSLPYGRDVVTPRGQSPEYSPALPELLERSDAADPADPADVPPPEEEIVDNTLVDIAVQGNETIETGRIMSHIKSQAGRPPNERRIKEDIRALYATKWFFSVERRYRMTDRGLVLVFRVVERPVIRSITIKGNHNYPTKQILREINIEAGAPYNVATNRAAARKIERQYRQKKSYPQAKVTLEVGDKRDDRDIVIRVEEGPYTVVRNTQFEGNSIRDGVLRMKLTSKRTFMGWLVDYSPIGALLGGKFNKATLPQDIAALKEYYHNLGYFDVDIERRIERSNSHYLPQVRLVKNPNEESKYEHLPLPYVRFKQAQGITYVYSINEGPRYRVRNLEVEGNEVFSRDELLADSDLESGEYFNARYLNKDVSEMKERYGELGRLFAKVNAVPRFIDGQPGIVDVVYRIDEDRPYTIRDINVVIDAPGGNPHTRETVVLNRILVAPGDLANPYLIDKSKGRLRGQIFESRGPNGPQIKVKKVEKDSLLAQAVTRGQTPESVPIAPSVAAPAARAADSSQPVGPHRQPPPDRRPGLPRGRPATPFGNPFAPFDSPFARAQSPEGSLPVPYHPYYEGNNAGDPYGEIGSPYSRALQRSGQADLDIFVTEAQTGRLMFGAGVNSDAGVVGSFVLEENNFDITRFPTSIRDFWDGTAFRGNGERFRIEAVPGELTSRYSASWQTPNFLNTDFSFGVSGFYFQRFFPDWDEERVGGRISLGYQIDRWWSLTGAFRLESVELTEPTGGAANAPPLLDEALGENFLSTYRLSLTHDTRDSAFLPTNGHFVEAAYEVGFGDFTYPRFELSATQHYTVYERPDGEGRHILTLFGEAGYTGDDTPIFERFYAGGFQSFRGFAFRGISARQDRTGQFVDEDSTTINGIPVDVGGNTKLIGSVQYSVPLTADEMIRAVAFTDFGTIEHESDFEHFRMSAGFGLRMMIPAMGPAPLAFDFGFPIASDELDDERIFTFSVGLTR